MSLPDSISVNVTLSVIKTGAHHSASISSIKDVTSFVKAEQRIIGMPVVAGKDGVDGADGVAATVTIGTVETLPPGSNAYVRNSGTDTDAVLDMGIPRGNAGEGASSWGDITGTLSDQTDLANALAMKANSADLGDLAVQDMVDYQTEVTNKPTLGTMSAVNDAPSDSKEYVRKNGMWTESSGGGGGGISSVAWGDITGTLSDQTDLKNALDAKASATIGNTSTSSGVYIVVPSGEEIIDFKATYNVTQSGSGTPSASNIRPFVSTEYAIVMSAYDYSAGTPSDFISFSIQLPSTIYGCVVDVINGGLTITHGHIASYNGETLPGVWYSDRDEYVAGTTPTVGAEVVYELETPVYQSFTGRTPTLFQSRDTYVWVTHSQNVETNYTVTGTYGTLIPLKDYIDQNDALKANVADLGSLATQDSVDYETDVTNKPTLGTMSAVNDAPSDSKEYVRKNGAWAENSGITSVAWGDVTGTLANQTDLANALAGKQNVLTFDSAPTASSTNPVESGGVKTALDAKQDTLTFDTTPTANSTNPVTSGGVKSYVDSHDDFKITGTVSSSGYTLTDPRINDEHWEVDWIQFTTESHVMTGVNWSTDIVNNTVTLSATYSGSTNVIVNMHWVQ